MIVMIIVFTFNKPSPPNHSHMSILSHPFTYLPPPYHLIHPAHPYVHASVRDTIKHITAQFVATPLQPAVTDAAAIAVDATASQSDV